MQNISLAKVEYVLFDWDGTLSDTRDIHILSINEVLAEYNLPDWNEVKKLRDTSLSLKNNFANIFGASAEEAFAKYSANYAKNTASYAKLFPFAFEVVEFLHKQGKKLMIVTNKDRKLFDMECNVLFPKDIFIRTICGNEAPKDKPYPDHIWEALKGYLQPQDITPDKVWLVGDSRFDTECALRANASPILIGKPVEDDSVINFKDFADFYQELLKQTNK